VKAETFIASDMRLAMALVRQSLGNDAVIIASRRVGDSTEITAARDMQAVADARQQTASGAAPKEAAAQPEITPVIRDIQEELGRLRMLFEGELAQLSWREAGRQQPNRNALVSRLEQGGIDRDLAMTLVDQILPCADLEQGWSKVLGLLGRRIPLLRKDLLAEGGVVALLGSTGVGKTTTAAKLAAAFALRHGRKHVAFVSTDRFKVGGQEQLVSFGSILGVPVQIAANVEEMKRTLDALSERKLVIIDTAGMSQRDMSLADQFAMLDVEASIQPLLVLPATARPQIIEETIRAFTRVNTAGAILTKMDECDSIGPLLSCVLRHNLPLTWVTDGQQVPDDLHPAEPKELLADVIRHYRHVQQLQHKAAQDSVRLQPAV
jgi:flagellar biosynthesis protein FlhF